MSTRTITGNLAADPEVVKAGSVSITKLRVLVCRVIRFGGMPCSTTADVREKDIASEPVPGMERAARVVLGLVIEPLRKQILRPSKLRRARRQ